MKRKEGAFWVAQLLIAVGVLALVALPSAPSTVTKISGSESSSSTSSCAPLFLIIANSSNGRRISAVQVQVEKTTPLDLCNPTSTTSTNLGTMETNVNGSIEVCCTGSRFFFTFSYLGADYRFNATAESAQIAECLWFYIPSATTVTLFAAPFDPQC